jgi:hypothetical protein
MPRRHDDESMTPPCVERVFRRYLENRRTFVAGALGLLAAPFAAEAQQRQRGRLLHASQMNSIGLSWG